MYDNIIKEYQIIQHNVDYINCTQFMELRI